MLSDVGVVCFAASYAVTLALEITRLLFRSGIRGAAMLGFAGAGLFAHTVYLYYQAANATGSPLSSPQAWYMIAAWALAATYLCLTFFHPKNAFGLFILPLVLGLIGVGTFWAGRQPFPRGPASRVWGMIHGVSILLAAVVVLVALAAGLMYLGQAYRLKRKLPPPRGLRLPSLEWLRRTNSRAIAIAILTLGVGILAGLVLNLVSSGPQAERLSWHDPVVLSTVAMFAWLVLCAGIGGLYKPAREGQKVALLTVLSFVFLVVVLGMVFFADTRHGGTDREGSGVWGPRFKLPGLGSAATLPNPQAPSTPHPLARISHHGVPLLAARQAVPRSCDGHCFCEAVAHCLGAYRLGERSALATNHYPLPTTPHRLSAVACFLPAKRNLRQRGALA